MGRYHIRRNVISSANEFRWKRATAPRKIVALPCAQIIPITSRLNLNQKDRNEELISNPEAGSGRVITSENLATMRVRANRYPSISPPT